MGLAWGIAGDAANDLDDLGEGGAVAHGEGVLGERPVEALLSHAERDDDVHRVGVLRRGLDEVGECPGAGFLVGVVDQVRDAQHLPVVAATHEDDPGVLFFTDALADDVEDETDLFDLVLRGFARVDVRDVDDGLLVEVEYFTDGVGVAALVEVVADPERLQVLVAVELVVIVEGDRGELRLITRQQHG